MWLGEVCILARPLVTGSSIYRNSWPSATEQSSQGMGLWAKLTQLATLPWTQVSGGPLLGKHGWGSYVEFSWALPSFSPHSPAQSQPPLHLWVPHTLSANLLTRKKPSVGFCCLQPKPWLTLFFFPKQFSLEPCAPLAWNHECPRFWNKYSQGQVVCWLLFCQLWSEWE